ncbi:MAG: hypothetical protein FWC91_07540, partial [Defluviitaleaceae bacterium]|nr:hypothetical protein [Defluviitaleaceae bacterium]
MFIRTKQSMKRLVAFMLIVAMSVPHVVFADESPWNDLPEIAPLSYYFTDFYEVEDYADLRLQSLLERVNEFELLTAEEQAILAEYLGMDIIDPLAEPTPEALAQLLPIQEIYLPQDFYPYFRYTDELSGILSEVTNYSALTESDRITLFSHLDISIAAYEITKSLFVVMERDGFTLAESIELVKIMSGGLFDYTEAQVIFQAIPSANERMLEIMRFEQFAQKFDISIEINERRLVNTPFVSTNEFGGSNDIPQRLLENISDFLTASRPNERYSFIETAQLPEQERLRISESPPIDPPWYESQPQPLEVEEYLHTNSIELIAEVMTLNIGELLAASFEARSLELAQPEDEIQLPEIEEPLPDLEEQPPEVEAPLPDPEDQTPEAEEEYPENESGHPYPENEYPENDNGHLYPENEYPENDNGHLYPENEYPENDNGHLYPEEKYPENDNGYPYPEDEYPENDNGYPYPEDEYPENDNGYPYPEDEYLYPEYEYPEIEEGYLYPEYEYPEFDTQPWEPVVRLGLDNVIQTRPWTAPTQISPQDQETVNSIAVAFTNTHAFNVARQMFLSRHTTVEIEAAFFLGATLQVEPQTFLLQAGVANVLSRPFDANRVMAAVNADYYELDYILAYGLLIMNFGVPAAYISIDPLSTATHDNIVVNPFNLHFNANESVDLNNGSSQFRMNILNLPGRGGFGLNLDLLYDSSWADSFGPAFINNTNARVAKHDSFGLGAGSGWIFDLPYISNYVLYLPGRGSFALLTRTRFVDYTLQDMVLSNDSTFISGHLWSDKRLTFHNGTSYYFSDGRIIGMVDRFGNTIGFEYNIIPQLHNMELLSRIVDTNGNVINFQYARSGNNRTITVTSPDNSVFTINASLVVTSPLGAGYGTFRLNSVINQVGAVTSFQYTERLFHFCVLSKIPTHPNTTLLLTQVNYPSGAQLRFTYDSHIINMGAGSRESFRVTSRVFIGDQGREYQLTNFTYQGEPTAFPQHVLRPPSNHTYSVTVTQNNGLRTVYTFNYRHLNTLQRVYNHANTLLSTTTTTYNNDRLPTSIVLTEYRGNFSRTTRQDFTYDRYGQLTRSVSPLAQGSTHQRYRTTHTYDNRFGLLLTTTSRSDNQTIVETRNVLSGDGRRIVRSYVYENDARQARTDFLHDAYGNVIETRSFPNSRASAFIATQTTFDRGTLPQSVRITGVHDVEGNLVGRAGFIERHFTYDTMWRTLSETDPNGYVTRWQYDAIGRITMVTSPNGGVVTYTYNDQRNTLHHQTVLGATYIYQYDSLGNLLTVTVDGVVIQRNTYDNRMRRTSTRNAEGVSSSGITWFTYDIFDRVIDTRIECPGGILLNGQSTTYFDINDAQGNSRIVTATRSGGGFGAEPIRAVVQYDRFGRRTQEGTIGGRITTYTHDLSGRVITQQSLGVNNTITHNVFGITSVTNIEGNTSRNTYDGIGRILTSSDFMGNIQRFTYDNAGRLIQVNVPFERIGNRIHYSITRNFYDRNGNLTRTSTLINLPGEEQAWANTSNTFRYNNLASSETGGSELNSLRTTYTYDLAGNVLTQRVGNTLTNAVTIFTYNNRGQLITVTDALGQAERKTYDSNGLLLTRTDRNGTLFRYTHDGMGRLIRQESVRNGQVVDFREYTFWVTGLLRSATNGTHTISYSYDSVGRVNRKDETGGIVVIYQYNDANNVTESRTYVNQRLYIHNEYRFDIAQRVNSVVANGYLASTYAYNANGNRIRKTLGNGVITEYTYNLANLVTRLTNSDRGNVLSQFTYTHYLDGNVSRVIEVVSGGIATYTTYYTYDLARRLIREETRSAGGSHIIHAQVSNWSGLRSAINTAPANIPITILIADDFWAPRNIAAGNAIVIPDDRDIRLVSTATGADGVRRLIQPNEGQRHFIVYGSLTLGNNIRVQGFGFAGGVFVRAGGTFIMSTGSAVEYCITISGGAVFLEGTGTGLSTRATFYMRGGEIRRNRTIFGNGGGVYVWGNSIFWGGGIITENEAGGYGGGVYVQRPRNVAALAHDHGFHMFDGSITNNTAAREGGGIFIDGITDLEIADILEFTEAEYENFNEILYVSAEVMLLDNSVGYIDFELLEFDNSITYIPEVLYEEPDVYFFDIDFDFYADFDMDFDFDLEIEGFSAALAGTGNPPGLITQRTYTFDNRGNRRSMTNSRHRYTVVYTYDLNNRLLSSTSTNGLGEQEITRYTYDRNGNQLTETIGNHTITNTYNTFNQLIGVTMPGMISSYTYRADGLRHSKTVNGATRIHGWNGRHIVIEYNAGGMIFNIFHRKINGNLIRSHQHGYYLFNARGDVVQRV